MGRYVTKEMTEGYSIEEEKGREAEETRRVIEEQKQGTLDTGKDTAEDGIYI